MMSDHALAEGVPKRSRMHTLRYLVMQSRKQKHVNFFRSIRQMTRV